MPNGFTSRKKQFRRPTWLFYTLLVCLGGPLNPAVWWLGWPDPGKSFDITDLLYFLIMPSAVMSCVALIVLRKTRTFDLADIIVAVMIGLVIAVLTAPIFLGIAVSLLDGRFEIVEVVQTVLSGTVLGWLFGVIPYFAVTRGIPCSVALVVVVLSLCRPAAEDGKNA